MSKTIRFVILIATAGRNHLLSRTLSSIHSQATATDIDCIIVVENGQKYDAEDIVSKLSGSPPIKYLHFLKANKSAALNLALRSIPDDTLVFFTDDDVRFGNDIFSMYREAANKYDSSHYFGGPIKVDYEKAPPDYLKKFLPASAVGWELKKGSKPKKFFGINWAAYVKDLKSAGGFDENFGPGATSGAVGQEHDMQLRLYEKGIQPVYLKDALVWHHVPEFRSTEKWVIHRKFRKGINNGLRIPSQAKSLKMQLSLIKRFLSSFLKVFLIFPFFIPSKRVKYLCDIAYHWGTIRGYHVKKH